MMKRINLMIGLIVLIAFQSCEKDKDDSMPLAATINVINAVTDVANIKVNPSGNPMSYKNSTDQAVYGGGKFYFAPAGMINLTAVNAADTSKVLFNRSFQVNPKVYTLYLSGSAGAVDTILREETDLPYIRLDQIRPPSADSVVNVRFVNLATGSPALKVKIATATGNEVDNLPYKGIGSWKAYPAKLTTTAYSFQIRRVDTDALVTTFSFSATATNRFKNVALVIRGVFGTTAGTAPFGLSAINYF